jgi:hypothetical protein
MDFESYQFFFARRDALAVLYVHTGTQMNDLIAITGGSSLPR